MMTFELVKGLGSLKSFLTAFDHLKVLSFMWISSVWVSL